MHGYGLHGVLCTGTVHGTRQSFSRAAASSYGGGEALVAALHVVRIGILTPDPRKERVDAAERAAHRRLRQQAGTRGDQQVTRRRSGDDQATIRRRSGDDQEAMTLASRSACLAAGERKCSSRKASARLT